MDGLAIFLIYIIIQIFNLKKAKKTKNEKYFKYYIGTMIAVLIAMITMYFKIDLTSYETFQENLGSGAVFLFYEYVCGFSIVIMEIVASKIRKNVRNDDFYINETNKFTFMKSMLLTILIFSICITLLFLIFES